MFTRFFYFNVNTISQPQSNCMSWSNIFHDQDRIFLHRQYYYGLTGQYYYIGQYYYGLTSYYYFMDNSISVYVQKQSIYQKNVQGGLTLLTHRTSS